MNKAYAHHIPSTAGIGKIVALREAFSRIHDEIMNLTPASREQSIAITNLETAAMWATKAIAVNDPEAQILPNAQH